MILTFILFVEKCIGFFDKIFKIPLIDNYIITIDPLIDVKCGPPKPLHYI